MKSLLLVLSFALTINSYSQDLSGTWTSTYFFGDVALPAFLSQVRLEFTLNPDSSYSVRSYSKIKTKEGYALSECKVSYARKNKTKLILEEVEELLPQETSNLCFQKFRLTIKQQGTRLILIGNYVTNHCGSGKIRFDRIE